jgi:cytoskeletal protein RodZ
MTTLGQDLKRERELRSVSLKEIATATKIGLRFLEALEADRWDDLPGPFFIKAIIRAYGKAIGADEDAFLNKYRHEVLLHSASEIREAHRPLVRTKTPRAGPGIRLRGRTVVAGLAILAVAAAAVFVRPFFRPGGKVLPVVEKPTTFTAPQLPAPTRPADLALSPESPSGRLRLELAFRTDTWVKISADGQIVLDGIKKAGESISLEADEAFLLHTGNAGGIDLKINGRPARPLGAPGVVRTDIRITRENYPTFLEEAARAAAADLGP